MLPAAGDVGLMADLLKDLEDPETLKEVEKLMNVRVVHMCYLFRVRQMGYLLRGSRQALFWVASDRF